MVARRVVLLVACAAALDLKLPKSPGQIVAAASTREVERVAPLIIPRGAAVLEIGSQLGRTTAALAAAAGGRIVGVDVARKAPRRASERSALFRNASGSDCCDFREVRGASWAAIDGALPLCGTARANATLCREGISLAPLLVVDLFHSLFLEELLAVELSSRGSR